MCGIFAAIHTGCVRDRLLSGLSIPQTEQTARFTLDAFVFRLRLCLQVHACHTRAKQCHVHQTHRVAHQTRWYAHNLAHSSMTAMHTNATRMIALHPNGLHQHISAQYCRIVLIWTHSVQKTSSQGWGASRNLWCLRMCSVHSVSGTHVICLVVLA